MYFPRNASTKKVEQKRQGGGPGSRKNWLKLKNAVHFIKYVSTPDFALSNNLMVSVCKKESRNENIEMLPSSFSHLYRTNPEDLRQEIPRHHQVNTLPRSSRSQVCLLRKIS